MAQKVTTIRRRSASLAAVSIAALAAVGSWTLVVLLALILLFLAFAILMVRSAKTDMSVRIGWKGFHVQRGQPHPARSARRPSAEAPRA
jgi:hypothetical protein